MSANTNVPLRVAFISLGLVLLGGVSRFAQRLRGWIDRRFFREACESDAILADLAVKVRTMAETEPLLETVATRIAAALHVARVGFRRTEFPIMGLPQLVATWWGRSG